MARSTKALILALLAILLLTAVPLISAVLASVIASANGCALNEGATSSCIIAGADRGPMLYTMFVMGWMMLFTLPVGFTALIIWAIAAVIIVRRRRNAYPSP